MKGIFGKLKDDSKMPDQGKFEGVKLCNIPASHLIWLFDNKKCSAKVREYIEENYSVLMQESHR